MKNLLIILLLFFISNVTAQNNLSVKEFMRYYVKVFNEENVVEYKKCIHLPRSIISDGKIIYKIEDSTAEMIFEDCKVHKSQVLGNVGDGFIQAMKVLDGGRISIAALSLGIAKGAFDASVKYSKEREQFGQPISNFQAISFKIADMATQIEAAELLTMQAADLKNRGEKVTRQSAFAKYYASEVAVRCSTEAVQIFGGYGYTKDFPVEKFYRDSNW